MNRYSIARRASLDVVKAMGLREAILTARSILADIHGPQTRMDAIAALVITYDLPRYKAQHFVDRFYRW